MRTSERRATWDFASLLRARFGAAAAAFSFCVIAFAFTGALKAAHEPASLGDVGLANGVEEVTMSARAWSSGNVAVASA